MSSGQITVNEDSTVQILAEEACTLDSLDPQVRRARKACNKSIWIAWLVIVLPEILFAIKVVLLLPRYVLFYHLSSIIQIQIMTKLRNQVVLCLFRPGVGDSRGARQGTTGDEFCARRARASRGPGGGRVLRGPGKGCLTPPNCACHRRMIIPPVAI